MNDSRNKIDPASGKEVLKVWMDSPPQEYGGAMRVVPMSRER